MNRTFISLLAFLLTMVSCKQVPNSTGTESPVLKELNKQTLQLDSTWNAMIKSDDSKIENLNRLVKELEMIEGSNTESLKSAETEVLELKKWRYNQNSMAISRNIDIYDSVTNHSIQKLKNESNQNPNAIKYQIINQLFSEIQLADDSVLFYRKEYDRTVDSFNNFIKTQKRELKKSGINVDTLKPYPVFRLLM